MAEFPKVRVILQIGGILLFVQLICVSLLWGKIEWSSGGGIVIRTGTNCSGAKGDRVSAFEYHINYCRTEFILKKYEYIFAFWTLNVASIVEEKKASSYRTVNSLWLSDGLGRHRSMSTLVCVMTCCLVTCLTFNLYAGAFHVKGTSLNLILFRGIYPIIYTWLFIPWCFLNNFHMVYSQTCRTPGVC